MKSTYAPLALMLLSVLTACSESDWSTPITPSPQLTVTPTAPTAAPRGPGSGTIVIRELDPPPGTKLAVQSHCPAGSVTQTCTDQWRGTFDVIVDREMTNAVLTVSFYDGQTICGYGAGTMDVVPAGDRVSFTVSRIYLSDEFRTFTHPCPLPATTNRLEVELWSDWSTWTNTLVESFERSYTFTMP